MSSLSMFMKKNKVKKENAKYEATKSLCDDKGNPLEWEIKALTTKEDEEIRDSCTIEVQVTGKAGLYRQKLKTNEYISKMIVTSVVSPNLYDIQLQDSYGVKTPEDLLKEMIDDPGEYQDLALFIQNFNGFKTMDERVKEAKN